LLIEVWLEMPKDEEDRNEDDDLNRSLLTSGKIISLYRITKTTFDDIRSCDTEKCQLKPAGSA
jgi:hypothetical protein